MIVDLNDSSTWECLSDEVLVGMANTRNSAAAAEPFLMLLYRSGVPYVDIADAIGTSYSAVASFLNRRGFTAQKSRQPGDKGEP
jgi:hypothetical protein